MSLWDKLMGKSKTTRVESSAGNVIEVANNWRIDGTLLLDGAPLLVDANPDLEKIFRDPNPPIPQKLTVGNLRYWEGADLSTKRVGLAIAYLQHPNPAVRRATIGLVRDIVALGVTQVLIDLLADGDASVRKAAAKAIWERQRGENCKFAVSALRDEIRGHFHQSIFRTTSVGLTMGREKAIRALDLLVSEAPDKDARKAIQELIARDVVIEERVTPVDISSVEFVGMDHIEDNDGRFTYEVYRAKSREQALAFLKTKVVNKELYYIEVETPEGVFGRDINGMYEV